MPGLYVWLSHLGGVFDRMEYGFYEVSATAVGGEGAEWTIRTRAGIKG